MALHRVFEELTCVSNAEAGREGAYVAFITVLTPQNYFFFKASIAPWHIF